MAFGYSSSPGREKGGYAGFLGVLMILVAILAMVFGGLDRTTDVSSWAVYSFEMFGGLLLASLFGFRLAQRIKPSAELQALFYGIIGGLIVVLGETVMLIASEYMSNQGLALDLLAPIAETIMYVVAIYQMLTFFFPQMPLAIKISVSDLVFATGHWYAYGASPDFLLILFILMFGNTVFVLLYHITHNATAPIIAHLIVNILPNTNDVGSLLSGYGVILLAMIAIFYVLFTVLGGKER